MLDNVAGVSVHPMDYLLDLFQRLRKPPTPSSGVTEIQMKNKPTRRGHRAVFANREHILSAEGAAEVRASLVGPKTVGVALERLPCRRRYTARIREAAALQAKTPQGRDIRLA